MVGGFELGRDPVSVAGVRFVVLWSSLMETGLTPQHSLLTRRADEVRSPIRLKEYLSRAVLPNEGSKGKSAGWEGSRGRVFQGQRFAEANATNLQPYSRL